MKDKIIVIYKSKYGSTKKYAEWIAEALEVDCCEINNVNRQQLSSYDVIVYGGGLYAIGINGLKKFMKMICKLGNKKVVVFSVGASPNSERTMNSIAESNFKKLDGINLTHFHLRGTFDYNKLGKIHKMLMKVLIKKIEKNKQETMNQEELGIIKMMRNPADWTKKENIEEIVAYLKEQVKESY